MTRGAPSPSARDKLAREKARSVADRYLPDPDAPKASGPWAAWVIETIEALEKQIEAMTAECDRLKADRRGASSAPKPKAEPKKLSDKEMAFAQEYIIDRNATQAAIRAGYSKKSAANIGYENVRKPHIAAVINDLIKERNQRTGWDPQKVLERLGEEGDADIAELFDADGAYLPVKDWPLVFRMGLVAGLETNELWEGAGEDRRLVGFVKKLKLVERTKIKELIGKHTSVNAFTERVEHDVAPPLQQLYQQLAGTGIRPAEPQPPGILPPQHAIRPRGEPAQET